MRLISAAQWEVDIMEKARLKAADAADISRG